MASFIDTTFGGIGRMRKRQFIMTSLSFGLVIGTALTVWKALAIVTGAESPIVVVLSGSMEPAWWRGDLMFLVKERDYHSHAGDVTVYSLPDRPIPIVHRVMRVHEESDGKTLVLTKGDANDREDRGLWPPGKKWLTHDMIIGRAVATMPYIGIVTIWFNEIPQLKWAMIATLALLVLINRE